MKFLLVVSIAANFVLLYKLFQMGKFGADETMADIVNNIHVEYLPDMKIGYDWIWVMYDDDTGYLEGPGRIRYMKYNLASGEVEPLCDGQVGCIGLRTFHEVIEYAMQYLQQHEIADVKSQEKTDVLKEDGEPYMPIRIPAYEIGPGWTWIYYNEDGSGHLESPEKKSYMSFDLFTGEVSPYANEDWNMIAENSRHLETEKAFAIVKNYARSFLLADGII